MSRVCPQCFKEIKSESSYFCYYCGSLLDNPTIEEKSVEAISPLKVKKSKGKQLALVFASLLVVALLSVSLLDEPRNLIIKNLKAEKTSEILNTEPPKTQPNQTQDKSIDIAVSSFTNEFTFGLSKFESVTPVTVDFYVEASNLKLLEETLVPDITHLREELGATSEETLADYFEDTFALFFLNKNVGIILKPQNQDLGLEDYKDLENEYSYFKVDDFIILYKDESVATEVLETSQKLAKNLGMDSRFLSTLKFIPSKGFAFGYLNSPEAFLSSLDTTWAFFLKEVDINTLYGISEYFYVVAKDGSIKLIFKKM